MVSKHRSLQSFALIGAGRVGTAVSLLLKDSGVDVGGVASRSDESAERAAEVLDAETFDHRNGLPAVDALLIGAGDEGIVEISGVIAPHISSQVFVCHFAGSLGTAPLASVAARGARPLALHPVQACPTIEAGIKRLPGSMWGVTCADEDFEWAAAFVERVNGQALAVADEDRPVWHAAAVSVSNGIAALIAVGEDMLKSIGLSAPHDVLGPLAAGTVANAREGGGGGATLTGPVVRNELDALHRHLEALRRVNPQLADEYAAVAAMIVRAAVRWGRLDSEAAELMSKILVIG